MKFKLLIICSIIIQLDAQSYQEIHKNAIFVDTHNDFLSQTMERNLIFEIGYTEKDIEKILGGNILRVLKSNENN